MKKFAAALLLAALGCGEPSNPEPSQTPVHPKDRRDVYEGTIEKEYFGAIPMPADSPFYEGWKNCWEYRFQVGERGFATLDYGDLALRRKLEDLDRKFDNGTKVRVRPTAYIFSIDLDRVIKPEDVEKIE